MYTFFFFFNDTATTEIYPLSLHAALPISRLQRPLVRPQEDGVDRGPGAEEPDVRPQLRPAVLGRADEPQRLDARDRKSTRLNSSHANISYAVFCLKKKNTTTCSRNQGVKG